MNDLIKKLETVCKGQIRFQKKREDLFQVYAPVYYEDGDMVDVFIRPSMKNSGSIQFTDCCTTFMKLSYTYEVNTPAKEAILNRIISQSRINENDGELILDSTIDQFFHSLMQITGCQQKIMNMRMWQRENIRSLFTQDLENYIEANLAKYNLQKNTSPIEGYPVEVDYQIEHNGKTFFMFGVGNNDKAKTSAIALLEFQKAGLNYVSFVIHEAIEKLPQKTQTILAENADKQFTNLRHFQDNVQKSIERLAA